MEVVVLHEYIIGDVHSASQWWDLTVSAAVYLRRRRVTRQESSITSTLLPHQCASLSCTVTRITRICLHIPPTCAHSFSRHSLLQFSLTGYSWSEDSRHPAN